MEQKLSLVTHGVNPPQGILQIVTSLKSLIPNLLGFFWDISRVFPQRVSALIHQANKRTLNQWRKQGITLVKKPSETCNQSYGMFCT